MLQEMHGRLRRIAYRSERTCARFEYTKYYRQGKAMSCAADTKALAHYPVSTQLGGEEYRIRAMSPDDGDALMVFARALPSHDTLYMRRDIASQSGIASWIKELRDGVIYSLLAEDSYGLCDYQTSKVRGCCARNWASSPRRCCATTSKIATATTITCY